MGVIPSRELAEARQHIHQILDPIWKEGMMHRKQLYALISKRVGHEFHTGELRTLEEARTVWKMVAELRNELKKYAERLSTP